MSGKRCSEKRWLEIHHIMPVAEGGVNELENLALVCRAHHQFLHH
jgi:predicted HNH restriction endonuclease